MVLKGFRFLVLTLGFYCCFPAAWAGTAVIDATTTYQFIRGFGAASAWNSAAVLAPAASVLWADDNVNGHIGLTMLRTRIDPTGNFAAEAAPMTLALSVNPNILIWSAEWSPPLAYKASGTLDGGGFIQTSAQDYADYQVAYVKAIQNTYGVTLFALSPQNEPDYNPTSYEACTWSGPQLDTYIANYLGPDFATNSLTTRIIAPESFGDNLGLSDALGTVSLGYLFAFADHLYGGGPTAYPRAALNSKEYWETEISDVSGKPNDLTMTSGLQEAEWIYYSLVNANMNAYHHWWIYSFTGDNSGLFGSTTATPTKKLCVLGNYSKFIRPGYYRMGATANPSAGVLVSAFENLPGSSPTTAVIVAINQNGSAVNQTFNFNGITADSVVPWVTDPNNNLVQEAAVAVSGGSFTYNLGAQSVVSFVGAVYVPPTPTPTLTSTPCMIDGTPCTSTPTPTITYTPTITFTPMPQGPVVAMPNLLDRDHPSTLFKVPEPGATLTVSLYTLAGELMASGSGGAGSSLCFWDSTGTASGLYLAVVNVEESDQSQRRKVLKIAVIH